VAKLLAALTVIYVLSPVDLIPDFIPVLGPADDLIIVPLLFRATLMLISTTVIEEIRARIDTNKNCHKDGIIPCPWLPCMHTSYSWFCGISCIINITYFAYAWHADARIVLNPPVKCRFCTV